jgi:hypothetical protein
MIAKTQEEIDKEKVVENGEGGNSIESVITSGKKSKIRSIL